MSTKEDRERIEWRQGTLDLLILRYGWGRRTATPLPKLSNSILMTG